MIGRMPVRGSPGAILVLAAVCGSAATLPARPPEPRAAPRIETQAPSTARPQDDLFQHVNGAWLASGEMPPESTNYGVFAELAERAERDVRAIAEEIVAHSEYRKGSPEQQVADLYSSVMDEARVDALGVRPLESVLRQIDTIANGRDFARESGVLGSIASGGPFEASVGVDPADATKIVVQLSQSGAMLPGRDDYLKGDAGHVDLRAKYVEYLATIFRLTARLDPDADARAVLALETEIARAQVADSDRTAPAGAERYTLDRLAREMPGFDWLSWARPQQLARASAIVLAQPTFFRRFAELAASTPLPAWKAWLAARYITASAPFVNRPFADARFEFFGRTLSGQAAPRARWRQAVSLLNGYLGDTIGRLYVEKHLPPSARARSERLTATIVDAFRLAIRDCSWLAPATKREALEKLARLTRKVGAPDEWRYYRGLRIEAGDLFGNVQRAQQFQNQEQMRLLALPPGRPGWAMPPQTVNASYSPASNEVVVPAAVLQPPLFDERADDAADYGAIGALAAHEIAHGFDQRGRLYDARGSVRDWWTPADAREFERRARRLVDQFDRWSATHGLRPTGMLTLGENLGDLVGLSVAFRAYRLSLGGRAAPVLEGLTGDQRFFLAWARMWRWKARPEYLDQWVLSSLHPHPWYRTNGPVSNLPAFYEAFGVKEGDGLFRPPADRVTIW